MLAAAGPARSSRAYLPFTGPAPLRFETLPGPGVTNYLLPALDMGYSLTNDTALAKSTNSLVGTNIVAQGSNAPVKPVILTASASPSTNVILSTATNTAATTNAPPDDATGSEMLSAQRLVQFFKIGPLTNGNETAVAVPLRFNPPGPPPPPPSSTATYRSE
ncbi:MAG TPA: hypothetical protein VHH73_08985 [Verrucomicrobiae bacterium]|nr:hypothetical protein [Verrucomicrobiae bacterium]